MNKREWERLTHQEHTLMSLGFTQEESNKLRRISMTLHRWYELECGDGHGHIERDGETGKPLYHNARANYVDPRDPRSWRVIPDREAGAKKRLQSIIERRNARITDDHSRDAELNIHATCHAKLSGIVSTYIQTDPRGAALYIIRPGDVPAGADVAVYYTRGACVY